MCEYIYIYIYIYTAIHRQCLVLLQHISKARQMRSFKLRSKPE